MKFEIITLFPDYFSLSLKQSLIGKAVNKKLIEIELINLRDFATDKHHTVDATPFGGGGGMVMMLEPLDRCLQSLGYRHRTDSHDANPDEKEKILLTSAAGQLFGQERAIQYSLAERLTIICGHYLGIDERLSELYAMDEISIGDYVLTGGEPAAAVIIDAVARLKPKVLGNFSSAIDDSHMNHLTGAPCYTKPPEYHELAVPPVLLSGNHADIKAFRATAARDKCARQRPDLLATFENNDEVESR